MPLFKKLMINLIMEISWKAKLNKSFFSDYNIIEINDIKQNTIYYKNEKEYIKLFIDKLKDKVFRNLPNINNISIKLGIFDKNNIFHILFNQMIDKIMKILQLPFDEIKIFKIIYVIVYNYNEIIYIGGIQF
jgi:hypothetical protein